MKDRLVTIVILSIDFVLVAMLTFNIIKEKRTQRRIGRVLESWLHHTQLEEE